MRHAGEGTHALRARGLIVVLWRTALRINEALSLTESDLDARRSSVTVREGKGGYRREVGIDSWALNTGLRPWLDVRSSPPSVRSSGASPPTPASDADLRRTN